MNAECISGVSFLRQTSLSSFDTSHPIVEAVVLLVITVQLIGLFQAEQAVLRQLFRGAALSEREFLDMLLVRTPACSGGAGLGVSGGAAELLVSTVSNWGLLLCSESESALGRLNQTLVSDIFEYLVISGFM